LRATNVLAFLQNINFVQSFWETGHFFDALHVINIVIAFIEAKQFAQAASGGTQ